MSYTVTVGKDEATAELARVHALLATPEKQRELMEVVGRKAEIEFKAWWQRRDAETPNKMGWPRQHFWRRIAEAANYDPSKTTAQSATVVVADPALAAKINGATIKPRPPHRALAIPMNAEAYATGSPGDPATSRIPGLFIYRSSHGDGAAFLVKREGGAGKFGNLTFYYRLVPEAIVPKDPQALPPADQLGAALGETAREFYTQRTGGTL